MEKIRIIITVTAMLLFVGCGAVVEEKSPSKVGDENLLTVDFSEGQTLRYKFVSSRTATITYDSTKKKRKYRAAGSQTSRSSESLEMVIAYTPVETDAYGLTKIEAVCESVKVKRGKGRRSRRGRKSDAVESIAGKTFTFTVESMGKMADSSELDQLIRQAGEKAFRPRGARGRIKEPDMVGDFIASQWFLWDSIASIEIASAIEGVKPGEQWKSQLWIPTPMIMRKARDVIYTLEKFEETEKGRIAVISSSYSLSDSVPKDWPKPYSAGRFRMSGPFGFYRNYKILELQGKGEQLFNIELGRIEECRQHYKIEMQASMMIPLGGMEPHITIEQDLTMQLLED